MQYKLVFHSKWGIFILHIKYAYKMFNSIAHILNNIHIFVLYNFVLSIQWGKIYELQNSTKGALIKIYINKCAPYHSFGTKLMKIYTKIVTI